MCCDARLYMWDGEYEGECELPDNHDADVPEGERIHYDGLSSWRGDGVYGEVELDPPDSSTVAKHREAQGS